jgi:hypothetical protein
VDFGDRLVGTTSAPVTVTVSNGGVDPYEISDVFLDGFDAGDFEIVSNACIGVEIDASTSCTISVRFKPTQDGDRLTMLAVDDGQDAYGVWLGGFAYNTPTVSVSPTTIAFPETRRNASATSTVTFKNTGDGPVNVGAAALSGADPFSVRLDQCSGKQVAPGASCTLRAYFSPRRVGVHSATLSLPSDGVGSPHVISLTGTAVPEAELRIEPAGIDFGLFLPPLGPVTREITVHHLGGNPVRLYPRMPWVEAGALSVASNTCGEPTLVAGSSCKMALLFVPRQPGPIKGALILTTGTPDAVLASAPLSGLVSRPISTRLANSLVDAARAWRRVTRRRLSRRGLAVKISLPLDGVATFKLFGRSGKAAGAAGRPLATGKVSVTRGKPATLRARLAPAGRRLIRAGSPVRLIAKLRFQAPDGRAWSARRSLLLER